MAHRSLVWFRSDLRLADNPALQEAGKRGQVRGLFVAPYGQWAKHGWGRPKVAFVLSTIRALHYMLAEHGIPLTVLECESFAESADLSLGEAERQGCDAVYMNAEYEVNETARDKRFIKAAQKKGLEFHLFHEQTILHPGMVTQDGGKPYTVYTPFMKNAVQNLEVLRPTSFALPPKQGMGEAPKLPERIATAESSWEAGEETAQRALHTFVETCVHNYAAQRDRVDLDGTSKLSHHLAAGSLSTRQCLAALMSRFGPELSSFDPGPKTWLNELLWRDFYRIIMLKFPHVCKNRPFREEAERIVWRDSKEDFHAWCEGRTGVPIVDAAMRALVAENWMHNRLRMVVAMYLTKDLLLDWRLGEAFFMAHLVDGDFASNNGGWQWSGSTGNDAAPYFRVFNPYLQSRKCDPEGTFIRKWLPELEDLNGDSVHQPSPMERAACGYPNELVDHAFARQRAIAAYERAFKPLS